MTGSGQLSGGVTADTSRTVPQARSLTQGPTAFHGPARRAVLSLSRCRPAGRARRSSGAGRNPRRPRCTPHAVCRNGSTRVRSSAATGPGRSPTGSSCRTGRVAVPWRRPAAARCRVAGRSTGPAVCAGGLCLPQPATSNGRIRQIGNQRIPDVLEKPLPQSSSAESRRPCRGKHISQMNASRTKPSAASRRHGLKVSDAMIGGIPRLVSTFSDTPTADPS